MLFSSHTRTLHKTLHASAALAMVLSLVACGGGSESTDFSDRSSSRSSSSSSTPANWVAGQFASVNDFWDSCENPRTGTDPFTNALYLDAQGSTLDENNLLRSMSNELYLWYDEITDRDPALSTTSDYFDLLKTGAFTPTGTPKDQFHWSTNTDDYNAQTQNGETAGYGVTWALLSSTPPREAVAVLTQPNSPASEVSLQRGARVISIDGIDLVNDDTSAGIDTLNEGLFPSTLNATHTFEVLDLNSNTTRTFQMTSGLITESPVNTVETINTSSGKVGYILFNSHIATAEEGLIDAVNQLTAEGVSDLVLDIRYNGGGFLYIASQLAYMIGGSHTNNKIFEDIEFNDKHTVTDPVTGQVLAPINFQSTTQAGNALPTLNLDRVFVLTGGNTCSASESVINGLRGADVEVIQIGTATCGKPYGAYIIPNCGTSYFTIQFKGANAKGFGDYTDGFFPGISNSANSAELPGCEVADDYNHLLGDINEARFAAALAYRDSNGSICSAGINTKSGYSKGLKPVNDGFIRQPRGLGDKILKATF